MHPCFRLPYVRGSSPFFRKVLEGFRSVQDFRPVLPRDSCASVSRSSSPARPEQCWSLEASRGRAEICASSVDRQSRDVCCPLLPCSHATLGLYKKVFYRAPKALQRWEMCSQVKVVTKVESEEELLLLQSRAKTLKLPTHVTIDAGKTQIAPNSRTVLAILGPSDMVDEVTGELRLL